MAGRDFLGLLFFLAKAKSFYLNLNYSQLFRGFDPFMNSSRVISLVLITMCATTIGCGGDPALPPVYPVTGKVTLQGAPLGEYGISFVSAGGDATASAVLGADGSYSLTTLDGRIGCTLGKYKVVIRPKVGPDAAMDAMKNMKPLSKGQAKEKSKLPDAFGAAGTSPKEVEVKAEPNVIDIAI